MIAYDEARLRELLQTSLDDRLRSYFQAILDHQMPRYCFDDLQRYKSCSDEIRTPEVPENDPNYREL